MNKKLSRILFGLTLGGLVAGSYSTASAQEGGTSQLAEQRRMITEAQTAANATKAEMDRARVRITALFKTQNPDYAKAEADATLAQQEITQSKAAALTSVRANPVYMKAVAAKLDVQTKMRALQAAGGGSDAEFNALAEQSIQYATLISKMEREAIEKDAKYNDAVARLAEAQRVVDGYKAQIDQACLVDPEYLQLAEVHNQALEAVAQANESMKQAVIAERQARMEAAKARAEERKNRSN